MCFWRICLCNSLTPAVLSVFRKEHSTPLFVFPAKARGQGDASSVGCGPEGHTNEKEENEMKQTFKRTLALTLCLLLCAALLPGTVWAAEIVDSGTCGANLTWTLDSEGTLTISGSGEMKDYTYDFKSPWYGKRSAINTVEIRSGVTSIGSYVLYECSSLTSVSIPYSVTSIGNYAFSHCTSLASVSIPVSVASIGEGAFGGCTNLTSVSIPVSVTSIGNWAFYGCSSLTSVTIPDGVSSIGYFAFSVCSSLTNVSIPNSVTDIGSSAFSNCSSLTSVSIPNSVRSIGEEAFFYCSSLTSISIPDSVTSIGNWAFECCSGLTNVSIPNSVTSIGEEAFAYCSSLTAITVNPENPVYCDIDGVLFSKNHTVLFQYPAGKTGSYTIPDSVTSIGNAAFFGCTSLTSVTIPNSVTGIGDKTFSNCTSLTSVTIPNSVTSIGRNAYLYCSSLTDVYFTGTKQEWKAMKIAESNDELRNATIHYLGAAPVVVLSPQNLSVNGIRRDVEKYNIEGYNYFKLRDIAYLLNGTSAQFSVEWDAAANAARLVSGQPYTANGSELVIGADRSSTAVRSPQIIVINGAVRSDLAAYNLAGNNFFKLRDLGEALGFQADFDAATNTAVVTTG